MSSITLRSVSKSFGGSGPPVIDTIDLTIDQGEFLVLLGPSGCGKTTILRMIAGFVAPSSGRIFFGERDVTDISTRLRRIGIVFQNYALFPNMSVAENIAFGPRQRGMKPAEVQSRVDELLELVQLTERRNRYPDQLSGGQQQRVALARAIAFSPAVLLMDEPLGALDVQLRETMQIELRRIQRELGITTVLVTHDQHEAMSLADRIVVMAGGKIQQTGSPRELYHSPCNRFVADFLGKNNLIAGAATVANGRLALRVGDMLLADAVPHGALSDEAPAEIAIRPQDMELSVEGEDERGGFLATVEAKRFLGNLIQYDLKAPWGQMLLAECSTRQVQFELQQRILVRWKPENAIILGAGTTTRPT